MMKNDRSKWIEKQINLERWSSRTMLFSAFLISAVFLLIFLYRALMPYLYGYSVLDTKEKAERFSQSSYVNATLPYETAEDMNTSFRITSVQDNAVSVFMNGAYMEVPLQKKPTEKEFHVWKLSGNGFTVLYCLDRDFTPTGRAQVQSQYRELSSQIISELNPGTQNVYVLYEAGSSLPLIALLAGTFILAVLFLILWHFPIHPKRTHLGGQIARMGEYKAVVEDLNRQALHPQFENTNCTVLQDCILFRTTSTPMSAGRETDIIPISDVTGLDVAPDEDDGDLLACSFHVQKYGRTYTLYLDAKALSQIQSYLQL